MYSNGRDTATSSSYRQKKQPIVIGYIADQAPFWNNIHHWVDFLNHDTPVLTGSERIIKKTGQAVFYGDVSRCAKRLLSV